MGLLHPQLAIKPLHVTQRKEKQDSQAQARGAKKKTARRVVELAPKGTQQWLVIQMEYHSLTSVCFQICIPQKLSLHLSHQEAMVVRHHK